MNVTMCECDGEVGCRGCRTLRRLTHTQTIARTWGEVSSIEDAIRLTGSAVTTLSVMGTTIVKGR